MTLTPNQAGFLAVIRFAEGTALALDPYRVTFGNKYTLTNLSDHPLITREWLGFPYDGFRDTAAGAYQITLGTWLGCKRDFGVTSFAPDQQDAAAIGLIGQKRGALEDIENGDIESACAICSTLWASLPGSTSGQPQKTFAELLPIYHSGRTA